MLSLEDQINKALGVSESIQYINGGVSMAYREAFKVISKNGVCNFHNVTDTVREVVKRSDIKDGIVVVYSRHTTCCVIIEECAFDMSVSGLETLQQDLVDVFENIIPTCRREGIYLHPGPKALKFAEEHGEDSRGCHNTDAHLRSSIIGRSETVLLVDGKMDLGEFGRIYFVDFDQTRARERTVQVMIIE
jgi:secondary thiamine-phosphate synthase enzyme